MERIGLSTLLFTVYGTGNAKVSVRGRQFITDKSARHKQHGYRYKAAAVTQYTRSWPAGC